MKFTLFGVNKMKKILILLAIAISFSSCLRYEQKSGEKYADQPVKEIVSGVYYRVVVVDSCEYILGSNANSDGFFFNSQREL